MARIRTVKPKFFRHEVLQDLEMAHPGKCPMLVFEGLWGHCDKAGRFEWKPRTLKLDILPFLPFDMGETLAILEQAKMVQRYVVDGAEYGVIQTFTEHQRIGGKEAQEPEQYPEPPSEAKGKKRGSTREALETKEKDKTGSAGEALSKTSDIQPENLGSTGEAVGIAGREGKGREGKGVNLKPMSGLTPDATQSEKRKDNSHTLNTEAQTVLDYLNRAAGRDFRFRNPKGELTPNADVVVARLKEGYTAEQLREIVLLKTEQWRGDEKMAEYLRPETLFGKKKFATYLGELPADSTTLGDACNRLKAEADGLLGKPA